MTGGTPVVNTGILHISDVAKTANYAYVAAGNITGMGKLAVIDLSTMGQVNTISLGDGTQADDVHGPTVSPSEGFLYVHSRGGSKTINASFPGTTYILDIGGGTAGGTKITPVLIGQISDTGTPAVSCGTDIAKKSSYCGSPALSLSKTKVRWASYADYTARLLTVDYSVGNSGMNANTVQIVGSTSTNGVTLATATPAAVGNIATGGSAAVSLKYNVPVTAGSFFPTTYATAKDLCNNTYAYPGPAPLA